MGLSIFLMEWVGLIERFRDVTAGVLSRVFCFCLLFFFVINYRKNV